MKRRGLFGVLLVAACSGGGASGGDLAIVDLATSSDDAQAFPDASTPDAAMAEVVDLATSPDLSSVFDLTRAPLPDLVSTPVDLKPSRVGFTSVCYPVGRAAEGTFLADVTGDGKPDLIDADALDHTLSVLPGNGDGSFRARLTSSFTGQILGTVGGDFNRDGAADFVLTDQNSGGALVRVYLSDGAGRFNAGTTLLYGAGVLGGSLAAGDLDGNGKLDILAAWLFNPPVTFLAGNGDGTFHVGAMSSFNASPVALHLVDLNGDGMLDVVSVTHRAVEVLLGNGAGTFGAPKIVAVLSDNLVGLAIGDFNGDNKLDVALGDSTGAGPGVHVLLGDGTGALGADVPTTLITNVRGIAAADFDNDGHADVMVGTDTGLAILFGTTSAALSSANFVETGGPTYFEILTAQFNGDSHMDAVATASNDKQQCVFLNSAH